MSKLHCRIIFSIFHKVRKLYWSRSFRKRGRPYKGARQEIIPYRLGISMTKGGPSSNVSIHRSVLCNVSINTYKAWNKLRLGERNSRSSTSWQDKKWRCMKIASGRALLLYLYGCYFRRQYCLSKMSIYTRPVNSGFVLITK